MINTHSKSLSRHLLVAVVMAVTAVALAGLTQILTAQELTGSEMAGLAAGKAVDKTETVAGDTLNYTIVMTHTGGPIASLTMSDTLPAALMLDPGTLTATMTSGLVIQESFTTDGRTITWTGTIANAGVVSVQFAATLTDTLLPGAMITNTALVTGTGSLLTPFATTTIVSETAALTVTKYAGGSLAPGADVTYTIVVSNGAGVAAAAVSLTDALAAELDYVTGTLQVDGGGTADFTNDLLSWNGDVMANTAVTITFNARLSESTSGSGTITNTVYVSYLGEMISAAVTVPYQTYFQLYLPYAVVPIPPPALTEVTAPLSPDHFATFSMTVRWAGIGVPGVEYVLEESNSADFAAATTYAAGNATEWTVTHAASLDTSFYYRVRAVLDGRPGLASNVLMQTVPLPVPTLTEVSDPVPQSGFATYEMTIQWTGVNIPGIEYVVEESTTPDFAVTTTYNAGTASETTITRVPSLDNELYYRVRAASGSVYSDPSNVVQQYGVWQDSMDDENSGWEIRKQDLDDTNNSSSYEDGGFFQLKIGGRWDYAVASPMVANPWAAAGESYRLEMRVRLRGGVDNLHSYGMIFGGEWDGVSECPDDDFGGCLEHYYRLNLIYTGAESEMRLQLKRIEYHDDNNEGRGTALINYQDVPIYGNSEGWNVWVVEVESNGTIRIFANGIEVAATQDTDYITDPYFGLFASSDEYLGSEPWLDYWRVSP